MAVLFGSLALYYSTMQPVWLRTMLAATWFALAAWTLVARSLSRAGLVGGSAATAVFVWYALDRPSNDRDWEPEYARPASIRIEDDTIIVHGVRNFSYRAPEEAIPAYYDARFPLHGIAAVDLVSSYWQGDTIAHLFLTFGFSDGRYLAVSIETRRAKGVAYSAIAGFFHHYELFYVVGDERDLIGVRTDVRHEAVYLYRLNLAPDVREALFLSYAEQVNRLASRPQWYNSLTDNCVTGILGRANTFANIDYNWQILFSGYAPNYAYALGLLDRDKPFAELRLAALVKRPPDATITETYSQDIRRGLDIEGQ